MGKEIKELLGDARTLLRYHEGSGMGLYPKSDELNKFLKCHFAHSTSLPNIENGVGSPIPAESRKINEADDGIHKFGTIDEIADEVSECQSCDLYKKRIVPVSGTGGSKVKLFIVGGWLTAHHDKYVHSTNSLGFGDEEDLMLERMLKAIKLTKEESFVSNVIKCGISMNVQPKAENIDACISYLYRQIAAVSPKIICTMGIVATKSLLKKSQPLSQLRGRFHTFKLNNETHIPLLPTYHPSFLLKNPEMKQATWNDLQMIQKELSH